MAVQPSSSWFTVLYDRLAYRKSDEVFLAWQAKMLGRRSVKNLENFVAKEIGTRGMAKFVTVADGSYNMIFRFKFSDGVPQQVALRFPKPGHSATALVNEKLENEVYWMQYLEEHNVIKVPHIYSWSTRGPDDIGPYILMDFVEGENLGKCLADWTRSDKPDDTKKRLFVYEQIAEIYLQLNRPSFDRIGSITKTSEGQWAITKRPLTLDMHQQVIGIPGFPISSWPTGPLSHSQDYKALVVDLHRQQLKHLRNVNIPMEAGCIALQEGDNINIARAMEIARGRYIARRAFAATSFLHDGDNGPFMIFNPDLHPRNMLVRRETAEITAVIDFEYTNAMPAAFARDPPLWLLPWAPEKALERDLFPWWMQTYEPVLKQFLAAMERVEASRQQHEQEQGPPLSALMRASWESRQCLVNFAVHNSDCVDAVYWAMPDIFPRPDVDPLIGQEVDAFQNYTKDQIAAYEKERAAKSGQK